MKTLEKFAGQIHRFVIPGALTPEQEQQFEGLAKKIESDHLDDPQFVKGEERFVEVDETIDLVVIESITKLCNLVGFRAYSARNTIGRIICLSC